MASQNRLSVPALALAAGGAVLIWAGVKGVGLVSGLRTLLSGSLPATDTGTQLGQLGAGLVPGTGAGLGAIGAGVAADSMIASAAMAYNGAGTYRWAGAKPSGWDCSGFVNYVIGHDLGLAIPGVGAGRFTGSWHGPVTSQWAITPLCTTIPRAQVQAGDLIVWPARHMGIAISPDQMINCPGPNGTTAPVIGPIDGHVSLGIRVCRRYKP